jgi:hypothetical protein
MVDEVEIKNVGGRYGVASEATMAALLQAMERNSRPNPGDTGRQSRRLMDLFNSHSRENRGLIKSTAELSSTFLVTGQRTEDFARTLANGNGILSSFFGFLDDNIDTLRNLSSSGASFNNSMFDMIESSAESAMYLTDFANMVKQNGDKLASFGGTVTNGAKVFGNFSRNFRSGIGNQFFEMGFTIEDLNDGLISFMDIERKRSNQELRFDAATQASAAEYIMQLDKLAKLTGEERKQLADRMAVQQQDAGIRNQLNRLNEEQALNLSGTMAFFESQLPGMSDGFKDLMDGVAQTDMGKAMETAMPGIREYMQRVFTGEESLDDVLSTLQDEFGPALEAFSSSRSKEVIDQMKASGGVVGALGELMDSTYQLNAINGRNALEAEDEQRRRNRVTSLMGKFEQALVSIRTTFLDAFLDSQLYESLSSFGTALSDSLGSRTGGLGWFSTRLTELFQFIDDTLSWSVDWIADGLKEGGALDLAFDYLEESILAAQSWFDGFVADIQSQGLWATIQQEFDKLLAFMKETFYSYFGLDDEKPLMEQLYTNMSTAFTNFWEGPYGQELVDTISNFFKKLVDNLILSINEQTGGLFFGEAAANILTEQARAGAELTPEQQAVVIEQQYEDRTSLLGELSNATVQSGLAAVDLMANSVNSLLGLEDNLGTADLSGMFYRWTRGAMQIPSQSPEPQTTNQDPIEAFQEDWGNFATGTNGFENFGNGSPAMLHGVEAVIPRNTQAGEFLSRYFTDDWDTKTQTSASQSSQSQESVVKHINQLNNTMMMVLAEIKTSNDLGKKTINSVKGLSGDLYRGI